MGGRRTSQCEASTQGLLLGILLSSMTYALVLPVAQVATPTALTFGGTAAAAAMLAYGAYTGRVRVDGQYPTPTCPECGSRDHTALKGGFFQCRERDCGYIYVRVGETYAVVAPDPRVKVRR